ncbi:MAG: hypothetical protein WD734_05065 [Dehalococcoidia bacterium]
MDHPTAPDGPLEGGPLEGGADDRASEQPASGQVRVLRAVCLKCGVEPPGITGPNGEDLRFPAVVDAQWLHELGAQRPHSWACDGQVQVETEPFA